MKYVYVIASDSGLFKVGVSSNPDKRAGQISCASGFDCSVVSTLGPCDEFMQIERDSHRLLREFSTRGEWFKCSKDEAINACDTSAEFVGAKQRMIAHKKGSATDYSDCTDIAESGISEFIDNAIAGVKLSDIEKLQQSGGGVFINDGELFFCTPHSIAPAGSIDEQCSEQRSWCVENGEEYTGIEVVNFDNGEVVTHV